MEPNTASYPIRFTFDPAEPIARWRPLVAWLLVIPHFFVLYAIDRGVGVRRPSPGSRSCSPASCRGPGRLPVLLLRYQPRVMTYADLPAGGVPAVHVRHGARRSGRLPARAGGHGPALTDRNRLTVFFRYFMVIPHVFVLSSWGSAAGVVIMIAWFAVIFTASGPTACATS